MFCTKCGKKLNDSAKFCTNCGNTINSNKKETNKDETKVINNDNAAKESSTQDASKTMEIHDTCDLSQLETQSVDTSSPEYAFQNVPPIVNSQQDTAQQNYVANDYQQSYQPQYQQNKNNNTALFVILGVLIVVIIAAVLVIFFMIKPFDSSDNTTNTTATKETQTENDSNNNNKSNNNNNNNSSTTNPTSKTVSCTAANGSTLTGTVRLKDGYVIPDSSTKSYSASEIAALGLNDAEMCIAWNEPYARAGYHFKNSGLQAYFNSCSWYHDAGFSGTLSDVGGQNTNTIKSVAGNSAWKNLATY